MKSLLPRAGLWVTLMHMAAWVVIAIESLGTGPGNGIVVHLPRATLLQHSWISYSAAAAGLILLLSAVYAWYERSTFRTLWRLTARADHSLFWGELKFNAIGITFLLAVSLASVSAHHWALDFLYRLPEARLVRTVFAESQVQLTLSQHFGYFSRTLPKKRREKANADLPSTKLNPGAEEGAPKEDSTENDDSSAVSDVEARIRALRMRARIFPLIDLTQDRKLMHMIFPFHLVLMALSYGAFCRALAIRHRVMAGWR